MTEVNVSEMTLRQKLHAIMHELERIPKNGRNDFHKYDYVREADVSDKLKPLMVKYRVIMIPHLESFELVEGQKDLYQGKVVLTWMDVDGPDQYTQVVFAHGKDSTDKAPQKAITGAVKQGSLKLFQVSTGDDPELDTYMHQGGEPKPAATTQNKPPAPATPAQVKQIHILAREAGHDVDEYRDKVKGFYGVESINDLTRDQAQTVLNKLAKQKQGGSNNA